MAFPPEIFSARVMFVAVRFPEEMERLEMSGLLPCTMWRPIERLPRTAFMVPVERSTDPCPEALPCDVSPIIHNGQAELPSMPLRLNVRFDEPDWKNKLPILLDVPTRRAFARRIFVPPSSTFITFITPDGVVTPPKEILLAVILFVPAERRRVLVALPLSVRTEKLPEVWLEVKAESPDKFTNEPLGRGPMVRSPVPETVRLPFSTVENNAAEPVDGNWRLETD